MKNDGLAYLRAYTQRKLGNMNNPYRVYEMITDEYNERGKVLIWNVNTLDYQIISSNLNSINLLQEEIPALLLQVLEDMKKSEENISKE